MGIRTMRQVIADLSPVPIVEGCKFAVGDPVMFTNDYGVTFGPHLVIGFDKGDGLLFKYGKHIYLDLDCYWHPCAESSLELNHNADLPRWVPKVAQRLYACKVCGAESELQTNHSGTVWASPCAGSCKDISNPHTERERVTWHPARPHRFIKELGA